MKARRKRNGPGARGAGRMVGRERIEEARAATIGPMVCELEGPMPILKTSKTERNIDHHSAVRGHGKPPRMIVSARATVRGGSDA